MGRRTKNDARDSIAPPIYSTPADVQALPVTLPRRISLHIQKEINSEEFGQLFITSMNKNSTKEEKAKVVGQTVKFGEMFAALEPVKKGDLVTLDWVPGTGTMAQLNGKKIGEVMPDIAFFNAVLRICPGTTPECCWVPASRPPDTDSNVAADWGSRHTGRLWVGGWAAHKLLSRVPAPMLLKM